MPTLTAYTNLLLCLFNVRHEVMTSRVGVGGTPPPSTVSPVSIELPTHNLHTTSYYRNVLFFTLQLEVPVGFRSLWVDVVDEWGTDHWLRGDSNPWTLAPGVSQINSVITVQSRWLSAIANCYHHGYLYIAWLVFLTHDFIARLTVMFLPRNIGISKYSCNISKR